MFSLRSVVLAVAVTFASIAQADYNIDPNSVPLSTRQVWCANELSTCPILCQQMPPGTTLVNSCDAKKLTYGCLCGNNKQPNISEYTLTLPYFICQEYVNQCVKGCQFDNTCSANCFQKNPCGATAPKRTNATTTSASPTASETDANTIFTGSPGGTDSNKKSPAPALDIGRTYGLWIVLGSMFVGFAML